MSDSRASVWSVEVSRILGVGHFGNKSDQLEIANIRSLDLAEDTHPYPACGLVVPPGSANHQGTTGARQARTPTRY